MADFLEGVPAVESRDAFGEANQGLWQDYFKKLNTFNQGVGKLSDSQVWRGQNTFIYGGNVPLDKAFVSGMTQWALKTSRTVGPGGFLSQGASLVVASKSVLDTRQQTWNLFAYVDDYSNPTELVADPRYGFTGAVGIYTKAYKRHVAPIWGGVFEVQDWSESDIGQMYGLEISIQSESMDPNNYRRGIAIFYGSRSGAASRHWAGLEITPVFNQATAQLGFGVLVNGTMSNAAYGSGSIGPTMIYGAGQYSDAAIKLSDATLTPFAIDMGGGSRMRFRSGSASGTGATTWYSGFPALTFIGVLEIVVDARVLYIPVSSTK